MPGQSTSILRQYSQTKARCAPVSGAEFVLPGQPAMLIWVDTVLKHSVCGWEASVHLSHESIKPAAKHVHAY